MRNKYYISVSDLSLGKCSGDITKSVADKENWEKCLNGAYEPKANVILNMVDILGKVIATYEEDKPEKNFIGIQVLSGQIILDLQNHWKKKDTSRAMLNMCQHLYRDYETALREYGWLKNGIYEVSKIRKKGAELLELIEDLMLHIALAILDYAQKDYM